MITRRSFLAGSAALAACNPGADSPKPNAQGGDAPPRLTAAQARSSMPTDALGKTGARISRIGLGGFHVSIPSEPEAIRIVRSAVDHGITFMDNSWDYAGGESERRMGKALEGGYRERVFLMTKADGRDKKAAAAQLDESLRRLRTDHVDLLLIHEVIRTSDPHAVFAPDGAIHALVEARAAGKIRFIGFSGHKDPTIHLEMLRVAEEHGFSFDVIMFPLNVMDAQFRSFQHRVLPVARQKNLGICTMKPMGGGDVLKSGVVSAVECLQYALSQPTDVVITGCDSMDVLDQALRTAVNFEPLSKEQTAELLARTRAAAETGEFEPFKTSKKYDSTAWHPEWLSSARAP